MANWLAGMGARHPNDRAHRERCESDARENDRPNARFERHLPSVDRRISVDRSTAGQFATRVRINSLGFLDSRRRAVRRCQPTERVFGIPVARHQAMARASIYIEPRGAVATARHYIRDLTYGANDGIITTFAGVAGGALSQTAVLVIGAANLAADGLSMAVGNFLSIRAHESAREAESLARHAGRRGRVRRRRAHRQDACVNLTRRHQVRRRSRRGVT
jgi:hypothetical protein